MHTGCDKVIQYSSLKINSICTRKKLSGIIDVDVDVVDRLWSDILHSLDIGEKCVYYGTVHHYS
jgi:hypothetical protein